MDLLHWPGWISGECCWKRQLLYQTAYKQAIGFGHAARWHALFDTCCGPAATLHPTSDCCSLESLDFHITAIKCGIIAT
jgi:hypothetical protein